MMRIRPSRPDDTEALVPIAAAGGSPDADARHLAAIASLGRVAVAEEDGVVRGFAGVVDVGGTAMVTDLFVDPDHHGRGIGGLLLDAVLDGASRRMTFSSTHPAALAAYASRGMPPRWRLLTMRGPAAGGGQPLVAAPWRHDRQDLVEHFRSLGATVTGDAVVLRRTEAGRQVHAVVRLTGDDPAAAVDAMVRALPAGDTVEISVPEAHLAAARLAAHGFSVVEHDVFVATDGVDLDTRVCSVHRGLC